MNIKFFISKTSVGIREKTEEPYMKFFLISLLPFIFVLTSYGMESDDFTYKGSEKEKLKDISEDFNKLINYMINRSIEQHDKYLSLEVPIEKVVKYAENGLITGQKGATVELACNNQSKLKYSKNTEITRRVFDTNSKYGLPQLPNKKRLFNSPYCNRKEIIKYLRNNLDRNWPMARKSMLGRRNYDKGKVNKTKGSIYENAPNKGILLKAGGCCDPIVNANGNYVGIDKIDHFLGQGYHYYNKYEKNNFDTKSALALGIIKEEGAMGLKGTGVKSYADLAANYAGMFFWANLLDGDSPFITCEKGRFKVARNFDIRNFANAAWDESINCSSFSSKELAESIDDYALTHGQKKKCPVDINTCEKLTKYYSTKESKRLLHPRCIKGKRDLSTYEKSNVSNSKYLLQLLNGL